MEQLEVEAPEVEPAVSEDGRPWRVRFGGGGWRRAGTLGALLVLVQAELERLDGKLEIEVERKRDR